MAYWASQGASEAGLDLCHLNLHKTFSTPHASRGPGEGAREVSERLVPLLPSPRIEKSDGKFTLHYSGEKSIGKVAAFLGAAPNVVRSYAWIMALGA